MADYDRDDLYSFPLLCWEGAYVAAYDLHLSYELDDGGLVYNVTPKAISCWSRSRPVSVTEIVEAVTCPRSVEVSRRIPPDERFCDWPKGGCSTLYSIISFAVELKAGGRNFSTAYAEARSAILEVLPGSSVFRERNGYPSRSSHAIFIILTDGS